MTYADPTFEGISGLMTYVNTISEGVFGFLIPPFIWICVFLSFEKLRGFSGSAKSSLLSASFLTALSSIPLLALGLISEVVFTAWLTVLLVSILAIWIEWFKMSFLEDKIWKSLPSRCSRKQLNFILGTFRITTSEQSKIFNIFKSEGRVFTLNNRGFFKK